MSLEIRRVGQYAYARGAALLVDPRDGHRVEIGPDDLGRGTGLLHLGNQLDRAGTLQRRAEVTDRWGRCGLRLRAPPAGIAAAPWPLPDAWTPRFHPGWTSSSRVSINPTSRPSAAPEDGHHHRGTRPIPRDYSIRSGTPGGEGCPACRSCDGRVLGRFGKSMGRRELCGRGRRPSPIFRHKWICV